jgi:protein MAK11
MHRQQTWLIIVRVCSVKAVETLSIPLPTNYSGRNSTTIVCTVSSDGHIHVYDLASLPLHPETSQTTQITPIADYDTKGTRLTCITVADGDVPSPQPITGKRKAGEDEEREEDGAEDDDNWPSEGEDVDAEGDTDEGSDHT